MGTRIASFSTIDGDAIEVRFAGNSVISGELTLSEQPVILSMEGGAEYKGIKHTSATINCITDGIDLLDLFTSEPLSVVVTITNTTTGERVFNGYTTPNNYNQSLSGYNDELSIECVDWLGVAKFVPYRLLNEGSGFQVLTLKDCLRRIVELLNQNADVKLCSNIRIVGGPDASQTTNRYDLLTLNESYFFDSTTPDNIDSTLTYQSLAMSCYDVLNMIAESLRSTWVQIGDTIYLIDYILHHAMGRAPYSLISSSNGLGLTSYEGISIELTEELFDEGATQISALPRYSRFSLSRQQADSIDLLQDPFDEKYLSPLNGTYTDYEINSLERVSALLLTSKLYDASYVDSKRFANFVGYVELKANSLLTSIYDLTSVWGDKKNTWNNVLRIVHASGAGTDYVKVFSRKSRFRTSTSARQCLFLSLEMEAAFSRDVSRLYPYDLIKKGKTSTAFHIFASISVGGKFFQPIQNGGYWTDDEVIFPLYFANGQDTEVEWFNELVAANTLLTPYSFESPPEGIIEFSLYLGPGSSLATDWYCCYIRKLALRLIPGWLVNWGAADNPVPEVESIGDWNYQWNYDEVSLPIEIREPLAEKWWGTQIEGVEYMDTQPGNTANPRYGTAIEFIQDDGVSLPGGNYSMIERIAALANMGAGYELRIPIRDTNNTINSLTVFTSPLWSGYKVITAIEKDLANNTATVTIQ